MIETDAAGLHEFDRGRFTLNRYRSGGLLLAVGALLLAGCSDEVPTALDEDQIPLSPTTVEVRIPFSEFGRDVQVFGGFGRASELGQQGIAFVARDFEGTLSARTLVRPALFPQTIETVDSTGTTRSDDDFAMVGGRIVVRFDSTASTNDGPVTLSAASIQTSWHAPSATWNLAVDTAGAQEPWPEPGGGPVRELGTFPWDPAEADSATIDVDSATVAELADTLNAGRGLRISLVDVGHRLTVRAVKVQVRIRPSINPDTIVERRVDERVLTSIFDPPAPPPDGTLRVGGVPSWRTTLRIEIPDSVDASPEVCAVVSCPIALDEDRVNFAALVLETRAPPAAYLPSDTVIMEVRAVMAPERLPKAPLGSLEGLLGPPREQMAPSLFASESGSQVTVPLTGYIRNLLVGETSVGVPVPTTVALMSVFEPLSIGFASFAGPGDEGAPFLRILLTLGEEVTLP